MLIKSIAIENFLPYKGRQEVKFSTDPDKNVTLIMGDNGAGKTSLAQAFEWCLYGEVAYEDKRVLNAIVRDKISAGSYAVVTVEIEAEQGGVNYTISRTQKYARKENGKMDRPSTPDFSISYKENGETKHIPVSEREAVRDKLLSSELSRYFFFDGEHVKNMTKELESGKSSDFADAVKQILGLQHISTALEHLKAPGNKKSVERSFRSQYSAEGDAQLTNSQNEIARLEKRIERLNEDIEIAQDEKAAAEALVKQNQDLLDENAESEEAQKNIKKEENKLRACKDAYLKKRESFFKLFQDGQYRLFSEKPIVDATEELKDEDKINKGVPTVTDKTIKYLLDRHECICGSKFEEYDEMYMHLVELMNYVPPKDMGSYISEFDKICKVRREIPLSLPEDLSIAYRELREAEKAQEAAEKSLEAAHAAFDSLSQVNIAHLRTNLNKAKAARDTAAGKEHTARRDIAAANNRIKELNDLMDSISVKSEKNREIAECLAYVEWMYEYLDVRYSALEANTREELEKVVNKFFTTIYDGQLSLELDDNYGVTVKVEDIDTSDEAWKTSSGQTLAIILAFIAGILDIAKKNVQSGDDLVIGDTYPLVMDAPLSDFDKTRINAICGLLPNIAEQVIIVIKDTDGELAEKHLSDRIGCRYSIKKVKDYQSEIRS